MGKSLDENGVLYLWNKIKEKFATKDVATQSANGLLSSTDKSKLDGIATGATKTEKSSTNGNIKINGAETVVYTHPSGTNPHGTTKSDVGLGNVGNFKAVSTVASQGLTDTEKSNARANIGAGTSNFSGNYSDLTNKPTIPTVGNGTITIKQAGISKGTFTMNQNGNTTIELTDNNTTYSPATTDHDGLMSSGDKQSLTGIKNCLDGINSFRFDVDSEGDILLIIQTTDSSEKTFPDYFSVQNLMNNLLESYAKKTDISNVYKYKGSVATVADLPASGNSVGDTYNVNSSDMNYCWTGTAWDALGGTFTIEYLTNAEIDNLTK